jgi:hypothetical protein
VKKHKRFIAEGAENVEEEKEEETEEEEEAFEGDYWITGLVD